MRTTAGIGASDVVDLYDSGTGRWSTAQLSQARLFFSATSVGTVAIFAGGYSDSKLLMIVFVCLYEGLLIAFVRCVMRTLVFVFQVAVRDRLLSYARHCRRLFRCCGFLRQRNRTMVDGSAQSGAPWSFRDICWNGGHVRWGY